MLMRHPQQSAQLVQQVLFARLHHNLQLCVKMEHSVRAMLQIAVFALLDSVVKIKQIQSSVQLVHLPQLGASNVIHAPKELIVQLMDCQHMCCVLMAHILTWKDGVIVNCVMLALDVQVLEWKHLKCVQMGHTVMQLGCVTVFCVQQGIVVL